MKIKIIFSVFIFAFLFVASTVAQGDVITVKEYKELAKSNDNVTLIDASKTKLYKKAHVKGAISMPYKNLNQKAGKVDGLMLSPKAMAKILGENGIGNEDMIVVYDEGSQKYSTRVYWLLKYLGAKDVKIMHKDNKAFRDARIKLTSAPTKAKAKTFSVNLNKSIMADIAFIKANPNAVVIDARGGKEFTGTGVKKNTLYSKGHMPGAVQVHFKDVLTEANSFKSADQMAKVITKAGLTPNKTYVVYCKTGVKASVVYASLKHILGYKNVMVYEGGYLEWEKEGNKVVK